MLYFIQIIFEIIAMITAYITNPIICLFANEVGELPSWAYLWMTYDNKSLDIDWMVYEHCVPYFAEYDFNKHYKYTLEKKDDDGTVHPGYTELLDGNFTIKERIQRYICRLAWLYRNCNYGFSYFINGREIENVDDLVVVRNEKTTYEEDGYDSEVFLGYTKSGNIFTKTWGFFYYMPYCKWFSLRIYAGWKIKSCRPGRHMLAMFISPFRLNSHRNG